MIAKSPALAKLTDLSALADFAPDLALTFAALASDIALVIDADGTITHLAAGAAPITPSSAEWVGRRWADTVSSATRIKIEWLLAEAHSVGLTRRREVNHATPGGIDVPVAYTAVRLGVNGPVLAVGRDLRAVAAIAERFNAAQQDMERALWQNRQAESRYRQLFQVATDAVLVVDALTLNIVEANAAAGVLFGSGGTANAALVGQRASVGIAATAQASVDALLAVARSSGQPAEIRVLAASGAHSNVDIRVSALRTGDTMLLLMRARAAVTETDSASERRLTEFVEQTPDAVTITDLTGRVMMANPAFAALCRVPPDAQVLHQNLVDLLGDPQNRLRSILSEARDDGLAERREALIGRRDALRVEVEISAALMADGAQACIGWTLRRTMARPRAASTLLDEFAVAMSEVTARMGAHTLPDMLHEVSSLAERFLLETALSRSQGDPAAAARMLGISADALNALIHDPSAHAAELGHDAVGDGVPPTTRFH